jgi:spore maturation protein B
MRGGALLNTDWIVPVLIAGVVGYGLLQRVGVYDSFVRGAGKGLKTAISVLPCLVAVMVAVEMMKASGALQLLSRFLSGPLSFLGLPAEVAPLVVVRPFSGMAALGMLDDIYRSSGPDSAAARTASVIMGSTETLFYTVAIYFGSVGIKKTRHTVPAAMVSFLVSILLSGILAAVFQ